MAVLQHSVAPIAPVSFALYTHSLTVPVNILEADLSSVAWAYWQTNQTFKTFREHRYYAPELSSVNLDSIETRSRRGRGRVIVLQGLLQSVNTFPFTFYW